MQIFVIKCEYGEDKNLFHTSIEYIVFKLFRFLDGQQKMQFATVSRLLDQMS